jgi:hypothetical protein
MSRLGYINREISAADEEGRDPELSDKDIDWAIQWERDDLLERAGLDPAEVREQRDAGPPARSEDPFNTAGVPRTGTDGMAETSGQVETPDDGDDMPDDYNDWKVDELRAELKTRQLPADGVKAELVARLEEDDASTEE